MAEANLQELAARFGGKPIAAAASSGEDLAALAAKHGGKPIETDPEQAQRDYEMTHPGSAQPGSWRRNVQDSVHQFLVATGRGYIDLWAGGRQILGAGPEYTKQQERDLELFKPMQEAAPVATTAGRIVGQVAPTMVVPATVASTPLQALGRAVPALSVLSKAGPTIDAMAQGGLQGFLNFVPEGESRAANTATGAAAAGLFTKGLQFAAKIAPKIIPGYAAMQEGLRGAARPAAAALTADDVAASLKSEGIDFATLPTKAREALMAKAQEAVDAGAPVTPAELARVVRAQTLPVPTELTKGQMTRDPSQLRQEFDLRRTSAGAALEGRFAQQEDALSGSMEIIKLKTGGASTPGRDAETGRRITAPIMKQARAAESRVSALYKQADTAGQTLAEVDASPLVRYLNDNAPASLSVPELNSIGAALKKLGVISGEDPTKVGAVTFTQRNPNIRELEEVRKLAVQLGQKDEAAGHFMREVKNVIDGMTAGKGGELYQKARAARVDYAMQFEEPGIVNRLIEMKSRTDRQTPFEDVFRVSVLNSSADDLIRLRDQLLQKGDNPKLRSQGIQAFKDLRAATLDYLKMGALNNAKEEWSHAGFKRAVENIGPEKLEALLGKNVANQIQQVLHSSADMRAVFNRAGIYNPGTASSLIEWIDRLSGVVGLGKAGTYARVYMGGAAKSVIDKLESGGKVDAAVQPLEQAFAQGASNKEAAAQELLKLYAGKVGVRAAPAIGAAASAANAKEEKQ